MYKDQVVTAGKNPAALNAVYELQLQDSNEHLKQTSRFYEGINELMGNLNASLDDTRKYRRSGAPCPEPVQTQHGLRQHVFRNDHQELIVIQRLTNF